jgi:hypothetical protein
MAKSKVKAEGEVIRPNMLNRNDFTSTDAYSLDKTTTIGKSPIGDATDIITRKNSLGRNPYNDSNIYSVED